MHLLHPGRHEDVDMVERMATSRRACFMHSQRCNTIHRARCHACWTWIPPQIGEEMHEQPIRAAELQTESRSALQT
eukprot:1159183-Pelagomonas_calceolata.AAC.25